MKFIKISPDSTEAYESWVGIADLADRLPDQWAIAGGQMVYTHAVEHGVDTPRPSNDADVVIDVRGFKGASEGIYQALKDIGFEAEGFDLEGRRHRWKKGDAQIDVLQPRYLGDRKEKALKKRKLMTIEAPGSQHLLLRTEVIQVELEERIARIRRPNLMGAISAKCAAYRDIINQTAKERHVVDALTLAPLLSMRELRSAPKWKKLEKRRITSVAAVASARHESYLLTYFPEDLEERITRLNQIGNFSGWSNAVQQ